MTRRQKDVLDLLRRELPARDGVAPTFREMADALGLVSKSGVHHLVEALVEQGHLTRTHRRVRSLALVERGVDLAAVPDQALLAEAARRGLLEARHG